MTFLHTRNKLAHFVGEKERSTDGTWNDNRMTRRHSLKIGTGVAVSAASIQSLAMAQETRTDSSDEICFMRAVDLLALIRQKKISAREVMQAHLRQIKRVNSKVNAI